MFRKRGPSSSIVSGPRINLRNEGIECSSILASWVALPSKESHANLVISSVVVRVSSFRSRAQCTNKWPSTVPVFETQSDICKVVQPRLEMMQLIRYHRQLVDGIFEDLSQSVKCLNRLISAQAPICIIVRLSWMSLMRLMNRSTGRHIVSRDWGSYGG